jgi:hypothetical protein
MRTCCRVKQVRYVPLVAIVMGDDVLPLFSIIQSWLWYTAVSEAQCACSVVHYLITFGSSMCVCIATV